MICQRVLTRRLALIGLGLGWTFAVMGITAPASAEDIFLASPMATDATDKQLINPWGISASGTRSVLDLGQRGRRFDSVFR